ncbi:glutathione S-transferase C-terminal domain-containing protein [Kitasatospora sp. A2-31]|uniref:glutathione S-transferase C-terminal domain-containing protein n=1 Tax=Kitasatospora sp. A2-31 TaxID=2916414 RepID=UPI001EEB719A|nr:glutathione S-transferase C-terminal domain-containing protein [Kitasatospora sp. A2-31]MCG6494437.1 glutathione S-transferase C-terminal domain-containing protein [Kitasatospora sp. A2-31]MCG6500076.1 glutathione S-transferase C-terminal domain-containing protein [Kitasatospora sp. A2-31]
MSVPHSSAALPAFRGRIGGDARSGHPAVPHRYRLHLALSCPDGLRLAVAHSLLGLDDILPVAVLPALPDADDGGYLALRPLFEAASHHYRGPASAPALSDDWSGRIVSTDPRGILTDLARRFDRYGADLQPCDAGTAVETVEELCEWSIGAPAQHAGRADADPASRAAALDRLLGGLGVVEHRLAAREYLLGDGLTVADLRLWVTLVQLDTVHRWHLDAAAVDRIADHPRLWAYARRLAGHPAFGRHLDLDGIARRHHADCRGREGAGAAMPIVAWAEYARGRVRQAR